MTAPVPVLRELDDFVRRIVGEELERRLGEREGDGYLSIGAAAKLTGYSTRSISRFIAEGRIEASGAGRSTRIRKSELVRALSAPGRTRRVDNSDPIRAAARDFGKGSLRPRPPG